MRLPSLALTVLAALAAGPSAAQDFSGVDIKTTKVADGVYMLQGAGGNIGVSVGEDGVFVIDDQYAPLSDKIRTAIAAVTEQPTRFVINTHWHGDHTGGNEALGQAGALIVAHENVRRRMSTEQFIAALDAKVPPSPAAALPVVTFERDVTFHLDGETLHVIHLAPSHTDGDSIVHLARANVLHAGDVFFNGSYPFIDASSGGSVDGVIAACETLLGMVDGDTRIIPGHGPLSDRAGLVAYREMLVKVRDGVAALKKSGKTLEEVQEAKPTSDYDETWGNGFMKPDRFVAILYSML